MRTPDGLAGAPGRALAVHGSAWGVASAAEPEPFGASGDPALLLGCRVGADENVE
jgi:hypothetical protein